MSSMNTMRCPNKNVDMVRLRLNWNKKCTIPKRNMPTPAGYLSRSPRCLFIHSAQFNRCPASSTRIVTKATPRADVKLIASDVDGTLLNHQQQLTPAVEAAVKQAAALGVPLVVATGKARGPWAREVLPRLGLTTPGVFLQGLLVYDADGTRLYEQQLPEDVARDCIALAKAQGITLTAYCGERILCAATDGHTDRLSFYKEPPPEAVGDLAQIVGEVPIQKLIFMAEQDVIETLRPRVELLLTGRASLTTALSGMLEVLPLGASKGAGLSWLLEHMGVDPAHVMALGDGENDVEMLQLAGLGVAMGNAAAKAKSAADVVLEETNDEDGVAKAIIRYVLEPRLVAVQAPS
ncbi:hypothetical protein Vretimale_10672 [Volvox reticuliferus]|uniref:Haloacid dehalogenase-like hydrolase n=1 Tax=Volvox reticuliferus TaxID=1737510 RepID=A0A8J4CUD4_9CHLO|nr:hypothetical protein Vretifemale_13921 [Volvox reticuliferus]GIM06339.1 hypothetical protein Vretimale_10672 [Volvox reticuliferus]